MRLPVIVAATALLAATAHAATGTAVLQPTTQGAEIGGTVHFEDTKDGLKVTVKLTGAPAGEHGFHIHEFGNCSDTGKAAGGHYNPLGTEHGFLPKDGEKKAHGGDMGNLKAADKAPAELTIVLPGVSLADGKHTVGGRTIIVHEKADDFSQPTGNAGGRIACGVIGVTGK